MSRRAFTRYETIDRSEECVCDICDREFNSLKLLELHLRVAHREGFRFKCDGCGEVLTSRKQIRDHVNHDTHIINLNTRSSYSRFTNK